MNSECSLLNKAAHYHCSSRHSCGWSWSLVSPAGRAEKKEVGVHPASGAGPAGEDTFFTFQKLFLVRVNTTSSLASFVAFCWPVETRVQGSCRKVFLGGEVAIGMCPLTFTFHSFCLGQTRGEKVTEKERVALGCSPELRQRSGTGNDRHIYQIGRAHV